MPHPRILAALMLLASVVRPAAAQDAERAARLVARGHEQLRDGEPLRALDTFARADRSAAGRAPAALLGLARTSLELGRYRNAMAYAERALAADPPAPEMAEGRALIGLAQLRGGEHGGGVEVSAADTEEALRAVLRSRERVDETWLQLAEVLHRQGKNDEAPRLLRTYLSTGDVRHRLLAEQLLCWLETSERLSPAHPGGDVTPAQALWSPPAEPTRDARRAGVGGLLVAQAIVDVEGAVLCAKVVKGLPLGLNEAAIEVLLTWRYQPAIRDGRPVVAHVSQTLDFPRQ